MNPDTLKALHQSIKQWEENTRRTAKTASYGQASCALCRLFNPFTKGSQNYIAQTSITVEQAKRLGGCMGCPVQDKTGKAFCEGSPFVVAEMDAEARLDEAWQNAARMELEFLITLLPPPVKVPTL